MEGNWAEGRGRKPSITRGGGRLHTHRTPEDRKASGVGLQGCYRDYQHWLGDRDSRVSKHVFLLFLSNVDLFVVLKATSQV